MRGVVRGGAAALAAVLAAVSGAQPPAAGNDRALAPMLACRGTADPAARVRCYDQAIDRLQQAVANRQVVVVDREAATQDRRRRFGFDAGPPRPTRIERKAEAAPRVPLAEDLAEIDSTVADARPAGQFMLIRLATGALWRTTESGLDVEPRTGTKVNIKRGLLGSFVMRIGTRRPVKAVRVG